MHVAVAERLRTWRLSSRARTGARPRAVTDRAASGTIGAIGAGANKKFSEVGSQVQ